MQTTNLIDRIEEFLKATGLSATRFGVLAAGDTKFVRTLRAGRKPRGETTQRVLEWMQANSGE